MGGSEKVRDVMVETFPDAKVWCLRNDDAGLRYPIRVVRESWIVRAPLPRSKAMAAAVAIWLDVHYLGNWSLKNDLVILWRTLRAAIAFRGAY